MDLTPLPICASLDQYQIQAKDLLEAFWSGDPKAVQCIGQYSVYFKTPQSPRCRCLSCAFA
jgi:hypothetical protein